MNQKAKNCIVKIIAVLFSVTTLFAGISPSPCALKPNEKQMFFAIINNDYLLLEDVIKKGVNVNVQDDDDQRTPLNQLTMAGIDSKDRENILKMCDLLLEHKANPNIPDRMGNTPLHYIVLYGQLDLFYKVANNDKVEIIINYKHSLFGSSYLHMLVSFVRYFERFVGIIPCGNLNEDIRGICSIMYKFLIEKGIDLYARNNQGQTATDFAEKVLGEDDIFTEQLKKELLKVS